MELSKDIFKAYDIRGLVETQLSAEVIECIGKVLGTMALELKQKGLVVGYDGRTTSPSIRNSLVVGILQAGCDVYDIGEVTTPMMYFATFELNTCSGVMITGSHNPPEYNGFKMMMNKDTLFGDDILGIYQRILDKKYNDNQTAKHYTYDIIDAYIEKITGDVVLKRKMDIVIDSGNGITGRFAPKLFRRLGTKVLGLYCDVDGSFPNHHPDPSQPKNLEDVLNAVKTTSSELGLAFDGDGDRLGVVTNDGNIIYPDRLMMLFAADILEKHPHAKVIYDVKSSLLLAKWIKDHNGDGILCKTGHSYIKAKIKETGALLAGEMSGHLFFNDRWYGFDDALYAGARLLEILSSVENPSMLLNALPKDISTPELTIAVAEGEQHVIMKKLLETAKFPDAKNIITIDGIRVEYEDGFGLVRASNTTPMLVLRFEAKTKERLAEIIKQFESVIKPYVSDISLAY